MGTAACQATPTKLRRPHSGLPAAGMSPDSQSGTYNPSGRPRWEEGKTLHRLPTPPYVACLHDLLWGATQHEPGALAIAASHQHERARADRAKSRRPATRKCETRAQTAHALANNPQTPTHATEPDEAHADGREPLPNRQQAPHRTTRRTCVQVGVGRVRLSEVLSGRRSPPKAVSASAVLDLAVDDAIARVRADPEPPRILFGPLGSRPALLTHRTYRHC